VSFRAHLALRLRELDGEGLLREPRSVATAQGPVATVDGREVVLLCSNDYLGHAVHPELSAALREGADRWGSGAGASRLVSGTMEPHLHAERALAEHVGLPAALLFSTGYAANLGAIQALVGPGDLVLSDQLDHASLIDGCRLSRARVLVYRHRDVDHAAELLAAHRAEARAALVVTDSLFSMEGDVAPLAALRALCDRWDAGLLVDEAHAIGTIGPRGRGACAAAGIQPDVLVGTLGKALGLAGAFAAGSPDAVRLLENRARSYVFSTAPSPALAAAVPAAVRLADAADDARARLGENARFLRERLTAAGLEVRAGSSAILPVLVGGSGAAMRASARLFERGVFVQGIRPPTVPPGTARLRVVPTAAHSRAQLERAAAAFAAVAAELPAR
jgi:8-amino-7-oxononanoate synthase